MADSGRARSAADSVTRARDIDRAQVSTVLDAAYAEGQLGADEYHDRTARAGTARTLGELERLTADLQSPAVFGGRAAIERKRFGRRHSGEYPARTRARDADRARTTEALDAARADGQLDADEHTAFTELASEARTLGDLSTLVAELQQRPVAPVKPKAHNTFRIATIAAVAVVGIGCFVWTVRGEDPPPAVVAAAAINYNAAPPLVIPTPRLTTLIGFVQFRDDYRVKFGDTLVDEAVLHDEHASAVRREAGNADWTADWSYRGGFGRSNAQISTRQREKVDIDLAQVNAEALGAALTNAAATVQVPNGAVTHFRIADDSSVGRPGITIFVRNEVGQSGHFVLALSGEVLKTYPYKG
ncbi:MULTISPECIES: DUF1707 SHOCT-like domain-containing protein [unclassified Nocardia]|uniref:DUF1707 SHOCT-like domain-containing protein n=1 Tax=unclassified Nocardia TaxID=2637762 RepID=UPI0033B033A8